MKKHIKEQNQRVGEKTNPDPKSAEKQEKCKLEREEQQKRKKKKKGNEMRGLTWSQSEEWKPWRTWEI